jgi:hypothetical protein
MDPGGSRVNDYDRSVADSDRPHIRVQIGFAQIFAGKPPKGQLFPAQDRLVVT